MSKPKVAIIGIADWAGSAYHACQAINSVGEFECRAITTFKHPFEYPVDIIVPLFPVRNKCVIHDAVHKAVNSKQYEEACDVLEQADIIHLWNTLMEPEFMGNGLPVRFSKIKVATWTGSTYRGDHKNINEISRQFNQWKTVVQDPLFKFPDENDSIFIPQALDVDSFKPELKRGKRVGTYKPNYDNPIRPWQRDQPKLREIVSKHPDWSIDLDYTMPHTERMQRLAKCSLFVLDLSPYLASWGRSGLEACALEVPTVQNSSEECIRKTNGELGEYGFVNVDWDTAEEKIDQLINDEAYRKEVGRKARKWIQGYFSYSAVGRKYSDVYKSVL